MSRLDSRLFQIVMVAAIVVMVPSAALPQSTRAVPTGRCTLVGPGDFAAARLPMPGKLVVTTAAPSEECRAIYGSGQMAATIQVALTQPMLPFAQMIQMCRSAKPPSCDPVLGIGQQAYYDRSGPTTGYGSIQEVMASVHGKLLAVRTVGMTVSVAKSSVVALARRVALRQR